MKIIFIFFLLLFVTTTSIAITLSGVVMQGVTIGEPMLIFGAFADSHQQQSDDPGGYNNHSDEKLVAASNLFEERNVDFVIGLGDLVDSTVSAEDEILNITEMDTAFATYTGIKYNIIGNHETEELTLNEFISNSNYTSDSYHSFDINKFHCVILNGGDAGNYFMMSDTQLAWLESDLAGSELKKLIFIHYRIDQNYPGNPEICFSGVYDPPNSYCYSAFARNAEDIRSKLDADGNVIAVFQGHHHINDFAVVSGIKYYTFTSMTHALADNNAYAIVHIYSNNEIRVEGLGRQSSYSRQ